MISMPHQQSRPQRLPRLSLLHVAMLLLPATAGAADLDYQLGASLLRTDNIGLSAYDAVSETVLAPRVAFQLNHDGPGLQAKINGDVEHLSYLEGTYDNEFRGALLGRVDWMLLPDRLSFFAENSLSQQPIDSLTSLTPDNQQQVNVFVAGPSFYARFGETTRGQLDLRYTNTYAEETDAFNGDRFTVAGRLERQLNPTDMISVNAEATKAKFDRVSSIYNYDRYDVFARYNSELASLTIKVDAGYTQLDSEGGIADSSGPLFVGHLGWKQSLRSEFVVDASYQLADAAQNLTSLVDDPSGPIIGGPGDPSLQIVPSTYRERQISAGYNFTSERLTLQLQPYYVTMRYVDFLLLDQDNKGISFNGSYRLRQQLSLSFLANRQDRNYTQLDREDKDTLLSLGLVNQFSAHWSGRVDLQYRKRDSSIPAQEYTENAVAISFQYSR